MKKEVTCCDSCERVLESGGLRIKTESGSGDPIDLCPDCLVEVLPEFSERTGDEFLTVQVSSKDFELLRGTDTEQESEEQLLDLDGTMMANS